MRFLLVVATWLVIVGGLYTYVSNRDAKRLEQAAPIVETALVAGDFSIEITPTFSTEKDPFALTTSSSEPSSLGVRLNGTPLPYEGAELVRGQVIEFSKVDGVLAGQNEIYVKASPPVSEGMLEHGIRVKLYQEANLLVEETIWAEKGALVSGTVSYIHQKEQEHHDH